MATLKSNGSILAKLDYGPFQIALMSNGRMLKKDSGGTWKRFKKFRSLDKLTDQVQSTVTRFFSREDTMPCWWRWRCLLISTAAFDERWKVQTAVNMLGDDVDGLWSELNDVAGVHITLEDCAQLVAAYRAWQNNFKAEQAAHEATRKPSTETCNPEA